VHVSKHARLHDVDEPHCTAERSHAAAPPSTASLDPKPRVTAAVRTTESRSTLD
jgi:hypothetical protein